MAILSFDQGTLLLEGLDGINPLAPRGDVDDVGVVVLDDADIFPSGLNSSTNSSSTLSVSRTASPLPSL
jgi:hypothetical protein